jgi:hypothetical protein
LNGWVDPGSHLRTQGVQFNSTFPVAGAAGAEEGASVLANGSEKETGPAWTGEW